MKKIIILLLVVSVSFGLSGCGKKKQASTQDQAKQKKDLVVEEDNSLFGWLKRGKAVECTIKSPEGDMIVRTKDNKVRIDGVPYVSFENMEEEPSMDGAMLTIGDWTYMWDKKSKKGTKMNQKKMEALAGDSSEEIPEESKKDWQDSVKEWEKDGFKYDCKEIKMTDTEFKAPEDVEFTDYTEFFTGMAEMGKEMQEKSDAGEQFNMEDLEEMAEQLKKQGIDVDNLKMPE